MSLKLRLLTALHRFSARALCDELGHDWKRQGMTADMRKMNVGPIDECQRCGSRRLCPTNSTASSIMVERGTPS